MPEEKQLIFTEVLDTLFTADPLPLELLYRLSDIQVNDFEEFCERWPSVPDERRRIIVRHMADITEDNYVVNFEVIFSYLFTDVHDAVRIAALDGVWDTTNSSLVGPIINLLQNDDQEEVKRAAASALAHYVLMSAWNQVPASIASPIIEALLAAYDAPESGVSLKCAALEALGTATHSRIPGLIEEAYESDWPEMQMSAIFAMGSSADSRWLATVVDELENPEAAIRAEAARAAGEIGGSDAVDALANLVLDEEIDVAESAVVALGQIGGPQAEEILRELSDNPDFEGLQESVAEALEELVILGGELTFDWLSIDPDISDIDQE